VKFYLDADLPYHIAERLRTKGYDAVAASEVGNLQISDREQLLYAARHGRCLVSRNIRHFVALSHQAVAGQEPHAGIIPCPSTLQGNEIRLIAEGLMRIAKRYPAGLGNYDVIFL
jgi:predicted nuclease of predicted toxin-antitoxin system